MKSSKNDLEFIKFDKSRDSKSSSGGLKKAHLVMTGTHVPGESSLSSSGPYMAIEDEDSSKMRAMEGVLWRRYCFQLVE